MSIGSTCNGLPGRDFKASSFGLELELEHERSSLQNFVQGFLSHPERKQTMVLHYSTSNPTSESWTPYTPPLVVAFMAAYHGLRPQSVTIDLGCLNLPPVFLDQHFTHHSIHLHLSMGDGVSLLIIQY
ncbi:hypothetical protein QCA50_008285 [Cerrena zonata]|uniref:Uncharacterized protein n=1 Tax=Cerrena zonata TaxID=2478898 RepID=A0AAW0G5V7_9APHY